MDCVINTCKARQNHSPNPECAKASIADEGSPAMAQVKEFLGNGAYSSKKMTRGFWVTPETACLLFNHLKRTPHATGSDWLCAAFVLNGSNDVERDIHT
jgi:hypothetical protein